MNSNQFLKQSGNICMLTGGSSTIIGADPIAEYSGDSIVDFKKFATKHQPHLLIGYLSYDLAYDLYQLPRSAVDDLQLPKIHFKAYKSWELQKKITPPHFSDKKISFKPTITKTAYNKSYRDIQDHIRKGDIYQINLTHRLQTTTQLPPRELFLRILRKNHVEFAAYLETAGFQILSASPERFIKIKNGVIETCPVKGTRKRGSTPAEDKALKMELLKSTKEAAELNMITDLLRNDIGKVSKAGSVKLQGHRLISKCPTVWHTYSRITGELNTSPLEALISMFPGGSITGCPKKRAIEIIDQQEKFTRGAYTGAIGYIAPQNRKHNLPNDLDFNIAIRTVIKKGNALYLQVGGGIVLDSTAQSEYQETLQKAASFMNL